jgi:hypothetical protein
VDVHGGLAIETTERKKVLESGKEWWRTPVIRQVFSDDLWDFRINPRR